MQRSGFFNARLINSAYDRTYNAEDYRDNLGALVSDGVLRGKDGELKVQAVGDNSMAYTVSTGWAWVKGAWYHNTSTWSPDTDSENIINVGNASLERIDRIVLRFNNNNAVRSVSIVKLEGTAATVAEPPALTRTNEIWDICLAEITIPPRATTLTQADIKDTREDKEICGWVTTPIGYDDFFNALDGKVDERLEGYDAEWQSMKDNWASVTLVKKYEETITLTETITSVEVPITQYNPNTDILEVFVNGIYAKENVDYTLSSDVITFILEKIAGTTIAFSVWKSIDGSEDVKSYLDLLTELQDDVASLNSAQEYNYICNGVNDNVTISELCNAFFESEQTDGKQIKINIYGDFKATAAYSGGGTSSNRYKWFNVSPTGANSRNITLDFSNCSKIVLPLAVGSYNIIFHGKDMTIIGAKVEAKQTGTGTAIEAFGSTNGNIKAIDCRFDLEGYQNTFIAETGTFENCIVTCSVITGEGYCFNTNAEGLIRIFGGEYKAYTQATGSDSMVLKQIYSGAVAILYAVNCPTVAKSGYRQTHAVKATAGTATARDTITTLTVTASTESVTIAQNKPDRG